MAEEATIVVEDTTKQQSVDQATGAQTTEKAKSEEKEELKGMAKIQANYDKIAYKYAELEKKFDDERKKNMTEKERKEIEAQENKTKLDIKEKELAMKELQIQKTEMIFENKWNKNFLTILAGNTIDDFKENAEILNKEIKDIVEKEVNARIAKGNPIPEKSIEGQDIFTIDELNSLPSKMGQEWMNKNLEKFKRSMEFHKK